VDLGVDDALEILSNNKTGTESIIRKYIDQVSRVIQAD